MGGVTMTKDRLISAMSRFCPPINNMGDEIRVIEKDFNDK